jgi:hypothetical protein
MRGTLNGEEELRVDDEITVAISDVREPERDEPPIFRLRVSRHDVVVGEVEVQGLSPDPVRRHAEPAVCDYCARAWKGALLLLGGDSLLVVDVSRCVIASRSPVRFIGKASLDFCEFVESAAGETVLAVSTFVLVALDARARTTWSFELPGPVSHIGAPDALGVTLRYYDTSDPALPQRPLRVSFEAGRQSV